MKATALTVVCVAFLVAIHGCGIATTSDRLNVLKDRIEKQDDQIRRLEDKLNAQSDVRDQIGRLEGRLDAGSDTRDDPAPRKESKQAQAKIDSIIKELEGKSLDKMTEREYNLLLAQFENESKNLSARAKADEAMTARKRQKTYQMVGCLNVVAASVWAVYGLFYIIREI